MGSGLNKRDVKLFRAKWIILSLTLLTLGPSVVFMTFVMVAKITGHVFKSEMSKYTINLKGNIAYENINNLGHKQALHVLSLDSSPQNFEKLASVLMVNDSEALPKEKPK